jgi:hypothetical protein
MSGERRADELDPVVEACGREGVGLLRGRRSRGRRELGVLSRSADGADEALEVAVSGDDEPAAALRRRDAVGMRHALRGEQRLAGGNEHLVLADPEPELAREHVEDLVLSIKAFIGHAKITTRGRGATTPRG